jgi:hypothetical protein
MKRISVYSREPNVVGWILRQVVSILMHIGFWILVPGILLIEGVSLLWNLAFKLSLPLYMCKDPEMRKRAHLLMLGATAGHHGCRGDDQIIVGTVAGDEQ